MTEKKMSDLENRFIGKLSYFEKLGRFTEADWDELTILHAYCKENFTKKFNDVFKSFIFTTVTTSQRNILERLLRIIEVEKSIPEEMRRVQSLDSYSQNLIPVFELNKKDQDTIFDLCKKMRKIIIGTSDFDEPHRLRLLNRLAAIEAEILKPQGMFDVVRGGIDDLGETLGKFGKNIKPLTDRMNEVVKIARKATKAYDQLPAPDEIEQLPKPEDFDDEQ